MTQVVVLASFGLVILACFTAAFLWLQDRVNTRHTAERADWARERAWLLQRIQAPSIAVAQFDPTDDDPEPEPERSEEDMRVFHDEQDEVLYKAGRL